MIHVIRIFIVIVFMRNAPGRVNHLVIVVVVVFKLECRRSNRCCRLPTTLPRIRTRTGTGRS
jgi:hypothetical protein